MSHLQKSIDNTTKGLLTLLMAASATLILFFSFRMQFIDGGSVDGKNVFVIMALANSLSIFLVIWYSFRHISQQYAWIGIVITVLMNTSWCLLSLSLLGTSAT